MPLLRVLAIGFVTTAWAAWLAVAPIAATRWSGDAAVFACALTYRAGAVICHQQTARSFHAAGVRMPVCARCFGLYAGASAGAVAVLGWMLARRRGSRAGSALPLTRLRVLVLGSGAPTLVLWAAEHLFRFPVSNALRAIGGALLGAAVAGVVTAWAGGASFEDTPPATAIH